MDDIAKKEYGLLRFDLDDQPCFYPFGKFVDGDKQMVVAPGHLLEGPNQIKPPNREWPHDGDGLERLGWQTGLSCIVLTPLIGAYNVRGINHHGRPIEALSESVPNEGPWHSMVFAGTATDVLQ
jgi:hypothetical protein